MATLPIETSAASGEGKFYFRMACAMATVIVAGFSLNLAMGRSTFAVPPIYHLHAFVFFGWVVLYLTQNFLVASRKIAVHRRLGWLSAIWVPAMLVLGNAIMVYTMRRSGGPFFFDQNEFLFANSLLLACFAALVFVAVRLRKRSDWHRRLMFCAMAVLTGPGLGRLLPEPLMIPHAWKLTVAATFVFPIIAMIADRRRHGRVHPAWAWGVGAIAATQIVADVIAYSPWGIAFTQWVLAGSPGAAQPMAAFLPPGVL